MGDPAPRNGLVRNTLYLTLAQAITVPLAVVSNAVAGRYLGAGDFGYLYLAGTLCAFAVMTLEWGQQGAIPALVARDRAQAGAFLGTSLVWRSGMTLVVGGLLAGVCVVLDYGNGLRWAIGLSFVLSVLNSFSSACKDTIRGFERTDIPAYAHVAQQLLMTLVMVPVLMLGGELKGFLGSHILIAAITVLLLVRSLRPVGVASLSFQGSAVKPLLRLGTPFVFFGLAMVIQPNIDAMFLSKLAPPEVVGWYGVSQRLIGLLIFPASALIGALYPTLCRLQAEDKGEFVRVSRSALYGVSLLAIPAALGCGLFPEVGVAIFGRDFSGAEGNLRVQSVFLFLLYFSMPLGTCILAANRHKAWALVQCISIAVSVVVNPLLIVWFQRNMGNGGLGPCLGLVISELLVVVCGVWLAPRGIFDRGLARSLLLALASGAVMALVALLTKPISLFLAVPLAVLSYGLAAWFSGALQPSTVELVKRFVARKFSPSR